MIKNKPFTLDKVAFYGRSLKEYERMFLLNSSDLKGRRVLDCPSGPASFCKEARELGAHVVAVDPLFKFDEYYLHRVAIEDMEHVISRIDQSKHERKWDYYLDLENLRVRQTSILKAFLSDYAASRLQNTCYLAASLPRLPFQDNYFDLALSGHLLFSYQAHHSLDFTVSSLLELSRVSKEVRMFPLRSNGQDRKKPFKDLNHVLNILNVNRISYEIRTTGFEFQVGANQLMILKRFPDG